MKIKGLLRLIPYPFDLIRGQHCVCKIDGKFHVRTITYVNTELSVLKTIQGIYELEFEDGIIKGSIPVSRPEVVDNIFWPAIMNGVDYKESNRQNKLIQGAGCYLLSSQLFTDKMKDLLVKENNKYVYLNRSIWANLNDEYIIDAIQ